MGAHGPGAGPALGEARPPSQSGATLLVRFAAEPGEAEVRAEGEEGGEAEESGEGEPKDPEREKREKEKKTGPTVGKS